MKATHRPDLFTWSGFDEARNLDFNGWAWIRPEGNVLIDPMPMSAHDLRHLDSLGGATWIFISNSDHTRAVVELSRRFGAKVGAPEAERVGFPILCDAFFVDGDTPVAGMRLLALSGSKTPGELAFVIGDTVIFGDLVRGHVGGRLNLLPDAKLNDRDAALQSITRVLSLGKFEAVLVGDGWPVFTDGSAKLQALVS